MSVAPTTPLQITIHPEGSGVKPSPTSFWGSEGPEFKDVLDTINPLQHIPIISSLYQSLTGDAQSTGAKLAGGALFGGPLGFLSAIFDSIIQSATGETIMGNVVAAVEGKPVPAMQTVGADTAEPFLSPNQRASYNAYTHTNSLLA